MGRNTITRKIQELGSKKIQNRKANPLRFCQRVARRPVDSPPGGHRPGQLSRRRRRTACPCAALRCFTRRSTRSILGAPPNKARAAEDGVASPAPRQRISQTAQDRLLARLETSELDHPVVHRARASMSVCTALDGADSVLRDTAVIARHQHCPLRERHEDRLVHLQLHRQARGSRSGAASCRLPARAESPCAHRKESAPT